jgi:hypothetical protein
MPTLLSRSVSSRALSFASAVVLSSVLSIVPAALAKSPKVTPPKTSTTASAPKLVPMARFEASLKTVDLIGLTTASPEYQALTKLYREMLGASNKHDIEGIMKHYSPQFISGDNMKLADLKSLITETWQSYPAIQYDSELEEIHVSGDWATIQTHDSSYAAIAPQENDPVVSGLPGTLESESKNQLYFKHIGDNWVVVGDSTTWEKAEVRYGIARTLPMTLSAPEQVKAGELYSTVLEVKPPQNSFAIVAVANQELTYPHSAADDKFRPMNSSNKTVQRVLKANSSNRNEIVTATIGLPSVSEGQSDRPSIGLEGIATIVKRVNVIPISKDEMLKAMAQDKVVRTSANGKINLEHVDKQFGQSSSLFGAKPMPVLSEEDSSEDADN